MLDKPSVSMLLCYHPTIVTQLRSAHSGRRYEDDSRSSVGVTRLSPHSSLRHLHLDPESLSSARCHPHFGPAHRAFSHVCSSFWWCPLSGPDRCDHGCVLGKLPRGRSFPSRKIYQHRGARRVHPATGPGAPSSLPTIGPPLTPTTTIPPSLVVDCRSASGEPTCLKVPRP